MPLRLVTCPETAHLELISYQEHPLGTLVDECSRFAPSCVPTCPRTCAMRFDRKAHAVPELDPDVCDVLGVGDNTNVGLDAADDDEADEAADGSVGDTCCRGAGRPQTWER